MTDDKIRAILKNISDETVALWDWANDDTMSMNEKYWAYNILKRLAECWQALRNVSECGHNDECLMCAMKDTIARKVTEKEGK